MVLIFVVKKNATGQKVRAYRPRRPRTPKFVQKFRSPKVILINVRKKGSYWGSRGETLIWLSSIGRIRPKQKIFDNPKRVRDKNNEFEYLNPSNVKEETPFSI